MLRYFRRRGKSTATAARLVRARAPVQPAAPDGLPDRPSLDGYSVDELTAERLGATLGTRSNAERQD